MSATTHKNLKGDELLIAVFNHFGKHDHNFRDESNIMLAFYHASKNPAYEELFENYHFDEDGIMPYSRELADGLNTLHQTSLMGKLNPSFSLHRLTEGIEHRYKKFIAKKLSPEAEKLVAELSEEVKKHLDT